MPSECVVTKEVNKLVAALWHGWKAGRDCERAAVVKWLRKRIDEIIGDDDSGLLYEWADRIEVGEHRQDGE